MGYKSNEKSIVDFCESKTESLSNWVRQVKSKSLDAKTRRNRDLRIIAILSNSLSRAESELISKQRERARRWAQMQADLGLRNKEEEVAKQHQEKIDYLWKNDLSGLDIPLRFAWACIRRPPSWLPLGRGRR
uniref:SFRICE_031179 n=1 Tax=Spodoptera frugiperda TaxID=7108 RepID=A0A2H1VV60_SPOFR